MTLLLKQLFAFIRMINSDTGHNQLAAGLCCGLIMGFAPFISIQTLLVLALVFFFRIQMGAAFISAFFFKFIAWLADPVADILGRYVLEQESLRPLFVAMYNMPLVPMTRFNNSIVMGSMIASLLLVIPMFFVFRLLILKYRVTVVSRFQQSKIWKAWTATSLYNMYCTYAKLYL